MRIFSKALLGATAIHGIYFMATMAIGYARTVKYEPDWEATWANVENLPSEVAFGSAPSSFLYVGSFLATVSACGIILSMHDKFSSNPSETGYRKPFNFSQCECNLSTVKLHSKIFNIPKLEA